MQATVFFISVNGKLEYCAATEVVLSLLTLLAINISLLFPKFISVLVNMNITEILTRLFMIADIDTEALTLI